MSETKAHELKLDVERSRPLGPGVREQRHFYCACGAFKVYGFDNKIMPAFRAHKKGA